MKYNFSAGPSMLPLEVAEQLANTLLNGEGCSVVEISHQSPIANTMILETTALFREIANIPDTHEILWSHGGARLHFSAIPMNLIHNHIAQRAFFVETGFFAEAAEQEARRYGSTEILASSKASGYREIPDITKELIDYADGSYIHIVTNNTTNGTAWQSIPDTGGVPLVGDFTSELLSREMDYSKFGVVFAGVQKNLGLAGLTVIVIRKDLLDVKKVSTTPYILDYKYLSDTNSYANTPNTFSIYAANLTLKWIKAQGGLKVIGERNRLKSKAIYDVLDNSLLYIPRVKPGHRSIINVTFDLPTPELLARFLKESEEEGLLYLAGYAQVGGIRASMYNAMPMEGALALADFMRRFEQKI